MDGWDNILLPEGVELMCSGAFIIKLDGRNITTGIGYIHPYQIGQLEFESAREAKEAYNLIRKATE